MSRRRCYPSRGVTPDWGENPKTPAVLSQPSPPPQQLQHPPAHTSSSPSAPSNPNLPGTAPKRCSGVRTGADTALGEDTISVPSFSLCGVPASGAPRRSPRSPAGLCCCCCGLSRHFVGPTPTRVRYHRQVFLPGLLILPRRCRGDAGEARAMVPHGQNPRSPPAPQNQDRVHPLAEQGGGERDTPKPAPPRRCRVTDAL